MEPKRSATRAMLQRVVNLTRHTYELQSSTRLTVPFWHNSWYRQASTHSDGGQGFNIQVPTAPTYALGPQQKFDFSRVQKLLQLELDRLCNRLPKSYRYDPTFALDFVQDLSRRLRRVIKSDTLNNIRYRFIVSVTIVQVSPDQQKLQSMAIVSRCLWNEETDGSITLQTKFGYDMVAIATAFVVYTD